MHPRFRFVCLGFLAIALAAFAARAADEPKPADADASIPAKATAISTNARPKKKLPPVTPLSLTNVLVAVENRDWLDLPVWKVTPRGRSNEFAGVEFRIEGLVQLKGQRPGDNDPTPHRTRVNVPVPANKVAWQTLHLLGASRGWEVEPGTKVAELVWRYGDGTLRKTPLSYGAQLRDWWAPRYEEPTVVSDTHCKAVWTGKWRDAAAQGKQLRLYLMSLPNPDTNKPLKSVEFVSSVAQARLFFLGLTLDPLTRGERDPDFQDLDGLRPTLGGVQYVTVVEEGTSKPIAGADVEVEMRENSGTDDETRLTRKAKTDANGLAYVPKPAGPLDYIEISAFADNYTGVKKRLNAKEDGPIAPNIEVKLKGGTLIGGLVLDPEGRPLPGATVRASRIYRSDPEKEREEVSFRELSATTDDDGRWQMRSVSSNAFAVLLLSAKHPDYISPYGRIVGDDPGQEEALLKLKHKIQMLAGAEVTGVVIDPDDKPVSGAKVVVGQRWSEAKRDVTTGADGRFHVKNLRPEIQAVTATAVGFSPASKTFTPGTNVTELTLKLSRGVAIRGVVVDPLGTPVEGARLNYEPSDWQDRQYQNLEWETTTGADGRFEWKDAPDREIEVNVFKSGFASRRGVKLKPGEEDNIVKLSKPRKILGVVGDEETNEPVTKFSVLPAKGDAENFHEWSDSNRQEFNHPQGQFTMDLNGDELNVIRVEAEDYRPKIVVLPPPENDYVTITVLLKSEASPSGVVLDVHGQPVPGAKVGLAAQDNNGGLQLTRGQLRAWNTGNVVESDAQGQFKLKPRTKPNRVVATSDAGFGEVAWAEFQQTRTVVLQPWGRIEGVVYSQGKPAAEMKLLLSLQRNGMWDGFQVDFNSYQVVSGEDGRFVMERVPPGSRALVHLIQTSPNSWQHANPTDVQVLPGETTFVEIGTKGASVRGVINSRAVTEGKVGVRLHVGLSTPMPPMPTFQTSEEAQAYFQSPEHMERMKLQRNYSAVVKPDGSFVIDGVLPGSYTLNAHAQMPKPEGKEWETIHLGNAHRDVTVGEEAAGGIVEMDVGELVLRLPPRSPPQP